MASAKPSSRGKSSRERVMFSLPPELMKQTRQYAANFHQGNNSGFVAAAIRSYIDFLRKSQHTARLRKSYAAAAKESHRVGEEWEHASQEAWKLLDAKQRGR